jgi:hypothetical protein
MKAVSLAVNRSNARLPAKSDQNSRLPLASWAAFTLGVEAMSRKL